MTERKELKLEQQKEKYLKPVLTRVGRIQPTLLNSPPPPPGDNDAPPPPDPGF